MEYHCNIPTQCRNSNPQRLQLAFANLGRGGMLRQQCEMVAGSNKCLRKIDGTTFNRLLRKIDAFGRKEFFQDSPLPAAHHGANPREFRKVPPGRLRQPEYAVLGTRKHAQPVAEDDTLFQAIDKVIELGLRYDEIQIAAQESKQKLH